MKLTVIIHTTSQFPAIYRASVRYLESDYCIRSIGTQPSGPWSLNTGVHKSRFHCTGDEASLLLCLLVGFLLRRC